MPEYNVENLRPRPPWPKGVSGNPAGSSKVRRLSAQMKKLLKDPRKNEELVLAWYEFALKGSFPHLKEILERTEGKLASKVELTENKTDWSALDNEGDTDRPSASASRVRSLPESGQA